jgi:hypothetical protein
MARKNNAALRTRNDRNVLRVKTRTHVVRIDKHGNVLSSTIRQF